MVQIDEAIVIVPHDPFWSMRYDREKILIIGAIGEHVARIEHIGSTAVPGLGAKPIIDITAILHAWNGLETCIAALGRIGYEHRGEAGIPGRQFFRKFDPDTGRRTCHLHLVAEGNPFFIEHVLFRDYLRAHPAVADAYYSLKQTLAERYGDDRDSYTSAKAPFISAVLENAGRWARQ
ncbi:MAG: GrpB family protein [Candidatus Edwardsbacteria bacterium]|nr:GrpB family protein [Candidatus Edwardsbacteria bacterium]